MAVGRSTTIVSNATSSLQRSSGLEISSAGKVAFGTAAVFGREVSNDIYDGAMHKKTYSTHGFLGIICTIIHIGTVRSQLQSGGRMSVFHSFGPGGARLPPYNTLL
jgi:hypothetical protein